MKQFQKGTSLVLVLAMVLVWVCAVPLAVSAASADDISVSYASHLRVQANKTAALRTEPNGSSTAKYIVPGGTMLTVQALHQGTDGGYWYEVLFYTQTLYVSATAVTMVDHLAGDVSVANVQSPASLAYGRDFAIRGDISATLNDIGTVTAAMYTGSDITKSPAIAASHEVNGKFYSLAGSTLDASLPLGTLQPGNYTYVLTADARSYYIDANGELAVSHRTVVLNTQPCVVTDWTRPNDELGFGIDVSDWNGYIDWSETSQVIDFAILRIGSAQTLDNRFPEYAEGCETYGVPYGVYHYSKALTVDGVIAEAQFVIDTLKEYDCDPKLPIWYDMETSQQASLSTALKEQLVQAFCDTIAEAGYQPGFYGFASWFSTSFQQGYLSSLPQWIAQVDGFSANGTATYDGGTWMWQYSWEGVISGISGDVDCNIMYAEFPGVTSDTGYPASCTRYPIHALGTTNAEGNLWQYPDPSGTSCGLQPAGTEVEITGLYKNASGDYWYQVNCGGIYGYIHAACVDVDAFLYDDLAVIDPTVASGLTQGSDCFLTGTLVSRYNTIHTTHAKMYSGEDTTAAPVLSSSHPNNSNRYNLKGSAVCSSMSFGSLAAGYYTYEISADVVSYYYDGSLKTKTENVAIWTAPVKVGSDTVTPPAGFSCSHSYVDGICSICGTKAPVKDYYLFGFINGADYACEEDSQNLGSYKFEEGQLTVTFSSDSYVGVKADNNQDWYMTDGWQGCETTSATLYRASTLSNADKLYVPGGVEVTFTLTDNGDDTFTLSYEVLTITPTLSGKNVSLSFEDEIYMNVYYSVDNMDSITEMGLVTWSGAESAGTIDDAEYVIPGYTYHTGLGFYMSRAQGIAAKNIGDTVYFKVYAKLTDGSYTYSSLYHYSAKTYAANILKDANKSAEMKALVVAMLNYGAAAQTHFAHNPHSLANDSLTAEQQNLVQPYSSDMVAPVVKADSSKAGVFVNNGGFTQKSASINFDSAFAINYYFEPAYTPAGSITMFYWTADDYNNATTLAASNATGKIIMKDASQWKASVEHIAAKNIDSTVYIAAGYYSDGQSYCSGVVAYSLGTYCVSKAASTGTMADLAAATAVYGYYAKQHFANG